MTVLLRGPLTQLRLSTVRFWPVPSPLQGVVITLSLDSLQRMSSTAVNSVVYRPPDSSTGTITSWIPLVTPYSMHGEDCTSAFWRWDSDAEIVAWNPGYGISVNPDLRCQPEAVTTWWLQTWLGTNTETVVSIGPLTCPEAFSQVETHIEDEYRTRVACCPS